MSTRRFEVIRAEIAHPKLTIAPDRVTLKLPTNLNTVAEALLTEYARVIDDFLPTETKTVRGRFSDHGLIGLQNNARKFLCWFSPNAGPRMTEEPGNLFADFLVEHQRRERGHTMEYWLERWKEKKQGARIEQAEDGPADGARREDP